ncbi:hypothetical protein ACS0PU_012547 [Formica fusca]
MLGEAREKEKEKEEKEKEKEKERENLNKKRDSGIEMSETVQTSCYSRSRTRFLRKRNKEIDRSSYGTTTITKVLFLSLFFSLSSSIYAYGNAIRSSRSLATRSRDSRN